MVYLIDKHCFLHSCDHLIPLKVDVGAASQNCGGDHIDRQNIDADLVLSDLLAEASFLPLYQPKRWCSQEQM